MSETRHSATEAGKILNITSKAARKAIASGRIKAVIHGFTWAIPADEVERFKLLRQQRMAAKAA
jgi:hypothetical protein